MPKRKREERKTRQAYVGSAFEIRPLPVRICNHIAEKGIYAMLLLAPVTFLSNAYWPFDVPKVTLLKILTLIVLGGYLGKIIASREWKIVKPPTVVFWSIIAYLAMYAISTIFSIAPDLSLQSGEGRNLGLVSLAFIIILFFLVLNIITERRQLTRCLDFLLISLSFVAMLGILQNYGKSPIEIMSVTMGGRASSTFGNPDFLFAMMILAVPVSYGALIKDQRLVYKLMYFTSSVILGWCIFLSMPKLFGDNLSLLVAFLIPTGILIFVYIPKVIKNKSHLIVGYSSLGTAALLILCLLIVFNAGGVHDNFTGWEKRFRGENTDRYMLAEIALDSVSEYPVIGSGPNTFRNTFTQYATVEYAQSAPERREDKVHNSYVETLATTGWLGFLTYVFMQIALFGYLTVWLYRNRRKSVSVFVFWILAAGIVYMAHTIFMFHTATPYTFFWILMAIALSLTMLDNPRVKTLRWNMSTLFSGFLLLLIGISSCIGTYYAVRPLIANAHYYQAEMNNAQATNLIKQSWSITGNQKTAYLNEASRLLTEAISSYQDTIHWNGSEVRYQWSYAVALLTEKDLLGPDDQEEQCALIEKIISGAIEQEPKSGMLYYNRGIFMSNCGAEIESVMQDIDTAIEMYPTSYMARQFRAQKNTEQGNLEQAIEDDEMALAVKPDNYQWRLRLGKNYISLGDEYANDDNLDTTPNEQYAGAINTLHKATAVYLTNKAENKLKKTTDPTMAEQKSEALDYANAVWTAIQNDDIEQLETAETSLEKAMQAFWETGSRADITSQYFLAVAYDKNEQFDEAEEQYEKTIEILESLIVTEDAGVEDHYMLGFCYERMSNDQKAIEAYQTVLSLKPSHKRAQEALERLGQ